MFADSDFYIETTIPSWPKVSTLFPVRSDRKCDGDTLITIQNSNTSLIPDLNFDNSLVNIDAPSPLLWSKPQTLSPATTFQPLTTRPTIHSNSKIATNALYISLYAVVLTISILGNSLVIATITSDKKMLRTITYKFLLSMAVSDLLIALVCLPVNLTGRILTRFVFGPFMCGLLPYLTGISVMVSTYTMLAISIERYSAICDPFGSRRWQTNQHAIKVIVSIWLASFVVMLPYAIASGLDYTPIPRLNKCVLACRLHIANQTLSKVWYSFLLIGMFCVPGVAMAIAYARVCVTIFKGFQFTPKETRATSERNSSNQTVKKSAEPSPNLLTKTEYANSSLVHHGGETCVQKSDWEQRTEPNPPTPGRNKAVFMLILIVIFYFIFWTPLYVANLWKAFDYKGAMRTFENSIEIIKLMSYISTCVNPVVYCFMNKKFRKGFIKAFICCLPQRCVQKVKIQQSQGVSEYTQQLTLVSSARLPRKITQAA